ncbi:hypothetical protein CALCODRAFT_480320 [Calocera cornea HHB12733]|uniref:Uncharacterized protein n=1 Tax=Calocera cornea HHB12733 TaxID=1353952 RepID=A0A165ISM9_9BASI|nr:hypothetical protein CALCODRAFT_480320 [Calocera cornea HHB12733]
MGRSDDSWKEYTTKLERAAKILIEEAVGDDAQRYYDMNDRMKSIMPEEWLLRVEGGLSDKMLQQSLSASGHSNVLTASASKQVPVMLVERQYNQKMPNITVQPGRTASQEEKARLKEEFAKKIVLTDDMFEGRQIYAYSKVAVPFRRRGKRGNLRRPVPLSIEQSKLRKGFKIGPDKYHMLRLGSRVRLSAIDKEAAAKSLPSADEIEVINVFNKTEANRNVHHKGWCAQCEKHYTDDKIIANAEDRTMCDGPNLGSNQMDFASFAQARAALLAAAEGKQGTDAEDDLDHSGSEEDNAFQDEAAFEEVDSKKKNTVSLVERTSGRKQDKEAAAAKEDEERSRFTLMLGSMSRLSRRFSTSLNKAKAANPSVNFKTIEKRASRLRIHVHDGGAAFDPDGP